jgi:hypothetical protein
MARSSYVYIVTNANLVVAGFTVKHELVSWLRTRSYTPTQHIFRMQDGGKGGYPVELDLHELLGEVG